VKRVAAWLLSFPLIVAGTQVAHALAFRWVYPGAHARLDQLLVSGHGYMVGGRAYLPILLGALGAIELVGVGWVLAGSVRRSMQRPVPAWAFALLPVLGFVLQEFLERWLAGASLPWWIVLQPTFQLGLALQLPFALIAYLLARRLLRATEQVALLLPSIDVVRVGACTNPPERACAGGRAELGACAPVFIAGLPVRGPPALPAL
jgi:hypothetical protein